MGTTERRFFVLFLEYGTTNWKKVALVQTDDVSDIFRVCNHIDRDWWDNPEVKICRNPKNHRSMSVGDLVQERGQKGYFLCDSVGWKPVKDKEEAVRHLSKGFHRHLFDKR